ncbi:MAG: DUF4832 domain-containing protein [Paludibacteraceae bacterium]|nr:DUF4832 domain-containing protein [Paludibacteraceae bacterium]
MKKTILSVLLCLMAISMSAATVTYTADNSTIFPNPERGFYLHREKHVTTSDPYCLYKHSTALNDLDTHRSADKGSLVLIVYYLDNYRTTQKLPSEILEGFNKDMETLREKGMKCILRFAYVQETYKYTSGGKKIESAKDAELGIALGHLSQYKENLQKNADVIYAVQAGFVGAWGEWYYTDNFGNHVTTMNSARRTLVDSLLQIVPSNRYVQLRTPLFKTGYVGSTTALTEKEAYKNTPKARLGHHNDAFLFDYTNQGTYTDTAKQKPYLAKETLYVPMGGECDVYDENLAKQYCTREKTVADMSRLHWTYINKGYATATTNMWRKNGTFDELNRDMGYRYQLVNGEYDQTAAAGGKMRIMMNIKNAGYAPLYNQRTAFIVFKNGSYVDSARLGSDPRTWLPNGSITKIEKQINVPANLPAGTYQLYLYLPDYSDKLRNDPRYAIRFANKNMWEESTGMNKLNAKVTVTTANNGGNNGNTGNNGTTVSLPGTLNKSNVASVSSDMTYYESDLFDFGPKSVQQQTRWAEWNVKLNRAGEYNVTIVGNYPNGHQWELELVGGNTTYKMPKSYKTDDVTETGSTTWNLHAGSYKIRVMNVLAWGQPKLKSVQLSYAGSAGIALPATLDKANVSAYSDDMTWLNNTLFDFGPKSVKEQTRWAEWEINVPSSGSYTVTIAGNYPNGHQWQMELVGTTTTYTMPATWASGDQTETASWTLPSGTQTLRIRNVMEWGQPKLQSITISAGVNHKPQAIENVEYPPLDMNAPMYDILGRQVGASYKGIVIQNGKKYLLK